jgi:ABC-type transport system involved in multi-copper enzyme maturation permease subunit
MNAAILIASRELRDRSRLFLIAAAMAIVPFGAALAVRENRPLAIAVVATSLAIVYACSLAIALGVSTVGRELTEKRLSFFFAKPVSAISIWTGKVAAGLLTIFGAFAIVVLPTFALVQRGWSDMWLAGWQTIVVNALVLVPILFFGGHAASTMLRSRSALVALDFLMFGVMLTALFAMVRPILLGRGFDVAEKMLVAVGISILAVLVIAPVWQIARGRIDPRQNHAALSAAVWSGVAVVLIVAAAYSVWVISPPLSGILPYTIEQSPSGRWIAVSGQPPNRGSYVATFLLDATSGRHQRLPTLWRNVHISGDGRTMIWLQSDVLWPKSYDPRIPPQGTFRLYVQALEPGARPQATSLTIKDPFHTQLSEDGSRFAVVTMNKLEIYEIPSGRLLGAATGIHDQAEWSELFFAGPNVVRIAQSYRTDRQMRRIREFDLTRRKVTTIAEWPAAANTPLGRGTYFSVNVTPDGSRIYFREEGMIRDTRTGAVLVTFPVPPDHGFRTAMLRDGSTVITSGTKLFHYDAKGTLIREVTLPAAGLGVTGQVGASQVLLSSGGPQKTERTLLLVDLATGKAGAALPGYLSTIGWDDATLPQFTENATIVVMDGERKLALWDLKTGAKRPLPS